MLNRYTWQCSNFSIFDKDWNVLDTLQIIRWKCSSFFCEGYNNEQMKNCWYREIGTVMVEILARFDWRVVGMLFHNHDVSKGQGNSPCHFALAAVYGQLDKRGHRSMYKSFDQTETTVNFTQLLLHIAERSRSEFFLSPLRYLYVTSTG